MATASPTTTRDEEKTSKIAAAIDSQTNPAWHAAYPSPKNSNPESISRAELLQLLRLHYNSDRHEKPKKDFTLIDLRRMDHE
ncbi:hypothetical protein MMC31_004579, partial [Peltigera leucophlebia]|nr:hypothetical protein [Peltigera leucophlebia]